ncbi:MAG: hypothetical protein B7733_10860 [Myxococcales bacterium FL481]|nr:MAG: hypothetical protein B7733_10860 [Myxococcales bacterium FL481]
MAGVARRIDSRSGTSLRATTSARPATVCSSVAVSTLVVTTLLDALKREVAFHTRHAARLRTWISAHDGSLDSAVACLYERFAPDPARTIEGDAEAPRPDLAQYRRDIAAALRSGLTGPHDTEFWGQWTRLGRIHVAWEVPQHALAAAMSRVCVALRNLVDDSMETAHAERDEVQDALVRVVALELAVMLSAYADEASLQRRQQERMVALGHITASISHELRNPLGVIGLSVHSLSKRVGQDAVAARHLARISAQVNHCSAIVKNLLAFIRDEPAERRALDLTRLAAESLDDVAIPPAIRVDTHLELRQPARGDYLLLRQAIANLLRNAVEAVGDAPGQIELRVVAADGEVTVSVLDSGPGFDATILPKAFEPLVSGKRLGTGLGLTLVKRAAERLGGSVRAENRLVGGAEVAICFPHA